MSMRFRNRLRLTDLRGSEEVFAHWASCIAEVHAGEDNGRLVLFNANIPIYEPARENHEPKRPRELLVKTRERNKLLGLIRREGMTLVPLVLYFNDRGVAKLQIGLAKGRRKQDKRQASKDRDWGREKARFQQGVGAMIILHVEFENMRKHIVVSLPVCVL